MELRLLRNGAFSNCLKAVLRQGESLTVERDALLSVAGTYRHEVRSGVRSGRRWVLKLYGQDLLHNVYYCDGPEATFRFAPEGFRTLGLLHHRPGLPLRIHPAAYFAHASGLTFSSTGYTLKHLAAGSPLLTVEGEAGCLVYKATGGVVVHELRKGVPLRVDEDAVVALCGDIRVEPIAKGGVRETLTSGEGFLSELSGTGTVHLQTGRAEASSRSGGGWLSSWLTG